MRGLRVTGKLKPKGKQKQPLHLELNVLSVVATDVLCFKWGCNSPEIRWNRLLRIVCVCDFAQRTEAGTDQPNIFGTLILLCK